MIKVEIIKGNKISGKLLNFINMQRKKDFEENNDFIKKDHKDTLFFIIKADGEVVSFGLLRNIKINYHKKNYYVKGIGGILSVKKKKGFGKILMKAMTNYLKETNQTGIGFCGSFVTPFYKKSGMKIKNNSITKFFYIDPKTKKEFLGDDPECDMIYIEGRDKFVSKILRTKERIQIPIPHW
ncbi:Uncharacterised protein [uncultured archaeon]|nr:Uncharacterised protein [uncultured archaeon]